MQFSTVKWFPGRWTRLERWGHEVSLGYFFSFPESPSDESIIKISKQQGQARKCSDNTWTSCMLSEESEGGQQERQRQHKKGKFHHATGCLLKPARHRGLKWKLGLKIVLLSIERCAEILFESKQSLSVWVKVEKLDRFMLLGWIIFQQTTEQMWNHKINSPHQLRTHYSLTLTKTNHTHGSTSS